MANKKGTYKEKKASKRREKLDMYDMLIANLLAKESIIEPDVQLKGSEVAIGFSNIASSKQISKYFLIRNFPDYMHPRFIDEVRSCCIRRGVKINVYFYSNPYKIDWDSAEMKNKMTMWRRYTSENNTPVSVFDYRSRRGSELAKERIITSTQYFNEAELEHKRTLMRVAFMVEFTSGRDSESIYSLIDSISDFKKLCHNSEIPIRELRVNMIDWLQTLLPFSLRNRKEIDVKISRKIMTDDILANFNSYKQGRIGRRGVPLGIDVTSYEPVMRKFKVDPDAAENWLIAAETGGGKSYFVKPLLTYLLADGFVVTVMDYEGDEYTNLAAYIKAGNTDDVRIISMGKGSTVYFDPMQIPDLTGDMDIDEDLKETAVSYVMSIFRIIVAGLKGILNQWEERVISIAIQRVYDSAGVTDNMDTWHRSKDLTISMVYDEIKLMVLRKQLVDDDSDNVKHKAACKIKDSASVYFEPGQVKSGTFKNPMSASELYRAKLIIFSFGMKGAGSSMTDPTLLALKQLSVACVAIQVSNYCKYVRKCFNVKVWEEYQRWGEAEGSAEIISNAMTGGRKRGDVNFIITNDLGAIINDDNPVTKRIRQNIQNMAVGKIKDSSIRSKFCKVFDLQDSLPALDKIAKAHTIDSDSDGAEGEKSGGKYKYAFCVMLDSGKKAIAKVMLPNELSDSKLFKTGVEIKKEDTN